MAPKRAPLQFVPVDGAERLERYKEGGYHPVELQDRLAGGRYEILNKLGFGTYSTVWLARDDPNLRYVAVKVSVASRPHESVRELEIRRQLADAATGRPWDNLVQQLLDNFVETGPNGSHHCLVSMPGGGSLALCKELSDSVYLFSLEVSRAICAQMIQATAFVHSQGIVHGDLHPGNLLLAFPKMEFMPSELLAEINPPYIKPIRRWDGAPLTDRVPTHAVAPRAFCKASHKMTLSDARILLTDFGESWSHAKDSKFSLNTARTCSPPEPIFAESDTRPLGPAADIWTLALSLFAVYARRAFFEDFMSTPDTKLIAYIEALGRPPQAWWDKWDNRSKYFDDAGAWRLDSRNLGYSWYPLADRIFDIREDREECARYFPGDAPFGDDEVQDVTNMLSAMLRWDPNDRITAQQLVGGEWIRRWGLHTGSAEDGGGAEAGRNVSQQLLYIV